MIDHLVLATPDVDATSAQVGEQWGVAVVGGGSHTGRGTRNALIGLGGSTYLEIVGPDADQPEPNQPRPFGVDQLTQAAFVAWCARPAHPLDDVLARLAAHGIDLGPAAAMSRLRPDGLQLNWQLTFPLLSEPHRGAVPFLIDWLDSPHPTASLPHDARLVSLQVVHPRAAMIRAVLAEIGRGAAEPTNVVAVEEGAAHLRAEISTPRGVLLL